MFKVLPNRQQSDHKSPKKAVLIKIVDNRTVYGTISGEKFRTQLGDTQKLAEHLGIHSQAIWNWSRVDRGTIGVSTFAAVMEFEGFTPETVDFLPDHDTISEKVKILTQIQEWQNALATPRSA
jgi:hypothetical protein